MLTIAFWNGIARSVPRNARANRMKDVLEAPDRVDKPMLYVPGGWLSKSDES